MISAAIPQMLSCVGIKDDADRLRSQLSRNPKDPNPNGKSNRQ